MAKGGTTYNLTYTRPPKKEKVAKAANEVKPKPPPSPGPKAPPPASGSKGSTPPPSVPKPIIKEIPPIEGEYHIAFEAGKTHCNFMQKEVDAYNILNAETVNDLNFNDKEEKVARKFINVVSNNYNNLPFINLDTNIPYYTYIEKHIEIYNGRFVGQKKKIETVNELYKIIKEIITTLSVFTLKVNENFLTRQNIKSTIVCGTPADVESAINNFNVKQNAEKEKAEKDFKEYIKNLNTIGEAELKEIEGYINILTNINELDDNDRKAIILLITKYNNCSRIGKCKAEILGEFSKLIMNIIQNKLNGGKRKYTKRKIAAPKKKPASKPTFTKLY